MGPYRLWWLALAVRDVFQIIKNCWARRQKPASSILHWAKQVWMEKAAEYDRPMEFHLVSEMGTMSSMPAASNYWARGEQSQQQQINKNNSYPEPILAAENRREKRGSSPFSVRSNAMPSAPEWLCVGMFVPLAVQKNSSVLPLLFDEAECYRRYDKPNAFSTKTQQRLVHLIGNVQKSRKILFNFFLHRLHPKNVFGQNTTQTMANCMNAKKIEKTVTVLF